MSIGNSTPAMTGDRDTATCRRCAAAVRDRRHDDDADL
jgi:hypothetical protein